VTAKPSRERSPSRRGAPSAALVAVGSTIMVAALIVVVALFRSQPPESLEDRVGDIGATLRCPTCQSLSVADSPSAIAREMRTTIARRLRAGDTPSQIRQSFVRAYGGWILLAPPRRGINWLVWLLPPLLLVGGLIVALLSARRWVTGSGADASTEELTPADRKMLDSAWERTELESE
jgi:cytochrome c-type biogenesis protein CcmH